MSGRTSGAVAVPVLPVSDLMRAVAWYGRLGFATRAVFDEQGYAIVDFDGAELHLVVHRDLPSRFETTSGAYLRVADADAVHARWSALGARTIAAPADQPYGIREFATEDPDGNLWRVGSPLGADEHPDDRDDHRGGTGSPGDGAPTDPTPDPIADPIADPAADEPAGPPTDGSAGTPDDRWDDIVASGTCAGCGLTASEGGPGGLAGRIRDEANRWAALLGGADDDDLRVHPGPAAWSALEYGVHVRDAVFVHTEWLARSLAEDRPELGGWDRTEAIADGMANESDAHAVADDIGRNADLLATVLDQAAAAAGWDRGATRSGELTTVEHLARVVLHELAHHRHDARQALQHR